MFLRFTTTEIDESSGMPQGIFQATLSLLNSGDMKKEDWTRLRAILDWHNDHLDAPPDSYKAKRAVFWFKSSAEENIRRMWEIVALLRQHGRHVSVYKCRRLGNIVWQDKLQVAAFASDRDSRITIQ